MALAMPEASAARTPHWASIAANSSRHMSSPGDRVTRWRWLLPTNRLGPADYDILGRRPWDGRSSATLHSARPTPASPEPLGKGTGGRRPEGSWAIATLWLMIPPAPSSEKWGPTSPLRGEEIGSIGRSLEIGLGEIVADEQQRHAARDGERVRKTIAEIEPGLGATLAPHFERIDRQVSERRADSHIRKAQ